jgi:hypothetical protein
VYAYLLNIDCLLSVDVYYAVQKTDCLSCNRNPHEAFDLLYQEELWRQVLDPAVYFALGQAFADSTQAHAG